MTVKPACVFLHQTDPQFNRLLVGVAKHTLNSLLWTMSYSTTKAIPHKQPVYQARADCFNLKILDFASPVNEGRVSIDPFYSIWDFPLVFFFKLLLNREDVTARQKAFSTDTFSFFLGMRRWSKEGEGLQLTTIILAIDRTYRCESSGLTAKRRFVAVLHLFFFSPPPLPSPPSFGLSSRLLPSPLCSPPLSLSL